MFFFIILSHQVRLYMKSLPDSQIPRYDNVDGMKYRNKQLLLQFPVQDSNFDRCRHIPAISKHVFDQFAKAREADMSTGHIEKAFREKVRCCNVLSWYIHQGGKRTTTPLS